MASLETHLSTLLDAHRNYNAEWYTDRAFPLANESKRIIYAFNANEWTERRDRNKRIERSCFRS